jgi:hypothetical protein
MATGAGAGAGGGTTAGPVAEIVFLFTEEGVMKEEYNFNLTVPLADLDTAIVLLDEARTQYPDMRLSRKPDRHGNARFYLCFPFHGVRTDLQFMAWFMDRNTSNWELFGPNYGIWGLS